MHLVVTVTRDPRIVTDEIMLIVRHDIQKIVAIALNCPADDGGALALEEVEVRVREPRPLDLNTSPFSVEVLANGSMSRRATIAERTEQIADALRTNTHLPEAIFHHHGAFVRLFLCPAHSFEL